MYANYNLTTEDTIAARRTYNHMTTKQYSITNNDDKEKKDRQPVRRSRTTFSPDGRLMATFLRSAATLVTTTAAAAQVA